MRRTRQDVEYRGLVGLTGKIPLIDHDRDRIGSGSRRRGNRAAMVRAISRSSGDGDTDPSSTSSAAAADGERALAPLDAELLDQIVGFGDAGGIEQGHREAIDHGGFGDDIAGGAGDRRDDGPVAAQQQIEQTALADIGTTDQARPARRRE